MPDLRDVLHLKRQELQQVKNRLDRLTAQRQALVAKRDDLQAEIAELAAFIQSQGGPTP